MPCSSNGLRILVVEDAEPLCKMIGRMLRENGYGVLEAADGAEALSVLAQEADPINLVLTDVVMPNMNGVELAQHLAHARPALPVLFMSGYTDDPIAQGVENGNACFLRKPFTARTLVETIERVLANGRASAK